METKSSSIVRVFSLAPAAKERREFAPWAQGSASPNRQARQKYVVLYIPVCACGSIVSRSKKEKPRKISEVLFWSERRESNPRESAWEADAIPLGDSRNRKLPYHYTTAAPKKQAFLLFLRQIFASAALCFAQRRTLRKPDYFASSFCMSCVPASRKIPVFAASSSSYASAPLPRSLVLSYKR